MNQLDFSSSSDNIIDRYQDIGYTIAAIAILIPAIFWWKKFLGGGACKDVVDLYGKTIIITGANAGIGLETAKALAKMNGHVIIACRDTSKGSKAVEIVKEFSGNSNVECMRLDLGDLQSVRDFVNEFSKKNLPLHILINNAGTIAPHRITSKDGFELQLVTNHLGPFLLTRLLIDELKKTKGRIVNVTSAGHWLSTIDLDDLNWEKRKYNSNIAYANSKGANILFTVQLQKLLKGADVDVFAVHPGGAATELHQDMGAFHYHFINFLMFIAGKTLEQACQTSLFAAVSPSLQGKGGIYLADCKARRSAKYTTDEQYCNRLWELSSKMVGLTEEL